MNSGIYSITNTVTGECYVGGSTHLPSRESSHFSTLANGSHPNERLQAAFSKYGSDAFTFKVLEFCNTDRLGKKEIEWTERLKPEYNLGKVGSNFPTVVLSGRYVLNLTEQTDAALRRYCQQNGLASLSTGLTSLIAQQLRTEGLL